MVRLEGGLRLQDQFSPGLKVIADTSKMVTENLQAMQSVVPKAFAPAQPDAFSKAMGDVRDSTQKLEKNLRDVQPVTQKNTQKQREHNRELKDGEKAAGGMGRMLRNMLGVYTLIRGMKVFIGVADEVTQVHSRLAMMNDGLQSSAELNEMIFQSAQRARGAYLETGATVASLGQQTGDLFSTNEELIQFAEVLNKQFAINSTPMASQASAMLQLTQALGSGVLRGEEFNAIFEASPAIIRLIADEMGVPIGQMRTLAAEGAISADIVKSALLNAVDETNQAFEAMPKTWEQSVASFQNRAVRAFEPAFQLWNRILNSPAVAGIWEMAAAAVEGFANTVFIAGLVVEQIVNWVGANWHWLEGIVWAVGAAAAFVLGKMIGAALIGMAKAAAAAVGAFVAANWWLLAIGATVGLVIWWLVQMGVTAEQVGGFIVGTLMLVATFFYNAMVEMANAASWFAELVINGWVTLQYHGELLFWALQNGWQGMTFFMQTVFADMVNAVIGFFEGMVNRFIGGINRLIGMLNSLPSVDLPDWLGGGTLGFNINQIQEVEFGRVAQPDASGFTNAPPKRPERVDLGRFERLQYGEMWDYGYNLGSGFVSNLGDGIDAIKENLANANDLRFQGLNEELPELAGLPGMEDLLDGPGGKDALKAGKETAKNTKSIDDTLNRTNEELSYLKDLATARTMTKISWDKLQVSVNNQFGDVHENADLDGFFDTITEGVSEAARTAMTGITKEVLPA